MTRKKVRQFVRAEREASTDASVFLNDNHVVLLPLAASGLPLPIATKLAGEFALVNKRGKPASGRLVMAIWKKVTSSKAAAAEERRQHSNAKNKFERALIGSSETGRSVQGRLFTGSDASTATAPDGPETSGGSAGTAQTAIEQLFASHFASLPALPSPKTH